MKAVLTLASECAVPFVQCCPMGAIKSTAKCLLCSLFAIHIFVEAPECFRRLHTSHQYGKLRACETEDNHGHRQAAVTAQFSDVSAMRQGSHYHHVLKKHTIILPAETMLFQGRSPLGGCWRLQSSSNVVIVLERWGETSLRLALKCNAY